MSPSAFRRKYGQWSNLGRNTILRLLKEPWVIEKYKEPKG